MDNLKNDELLATQKELEETKAELANLKKELDSTRQKSKKSVLTILVASIVCVVISLGIAIAGLFLPVATAKDGDKTPSKETTTTVPSGDDKDNGTQNTTPGDTTNPDDTIPIDTVNDKITPEIYQLIEDYEFSHDEINKNVTIASFQALGEPVFTIHRSDQNGIFDTLYYVHNVGEYVNHYQKELKNPNGSLILSIDYFNANYLFGNYEFASKYSCFNKIDSNKVVYYNDENAIQLVEDYAIALTFKDGIFNRTGY